VRGLCEHLLPIATILTPNVPEALLLLSDSGNPTAQPKNVEDLITIAKAVQALGPRYVLVKGGHLPFKKDGSVAKTDAERELMIDILYGENEVTKIEKPYQVSKNTHGTGCSLACKCTLLHIEQFLTLASCCCIQSCESIEYGASGKKSLHIR
jgi:hydroxymethylpyrimidine/phosphomethylpyrimidine kinase